MRRRIQLAEIVHRMHDAPREEVEPQTIDEGPSEIGIVLAVSQSTKAGRRGLSLFELQVLAVQEGSRHVVARILEGRLGMVICAAAGLHGAFGDLLEIAADLAEEGGQRPSARAGPSCGMDRRDTGHIAVARP